MEVTIRLEHVLVQNQQKDFTLLKEKKSFSLKIWYGNWNTGRCGGFELTTNEKNIDNQNRIFSVPAPRDGDPYEPELGSGILIGVFGKCGEDIDNLGFALLRRVESAQLLEVNYPNISTLLVPTGPKYIKTITYDNSGGTTPQTFTFSGSESVQTSESWSVTSGLEVGVETEVKAGFPILAEAKVKVSVQLSISGTYGRSTTKTTENSYSFPVEAPAGKHLQATATLYEGNINTTYTAKMQYHLDSGKQFVYSVSGSYEGVSVSEAAVKTVTF